MNTQIKALRDIAQDTRVAPVLPESYTLRDSNGHVVMTGLSYARAMIYAVYYQGATITRDTQ